NGSAGLVSTADDFNAFAQMMLNGGRLGSERILSRPSVELMTTDQLPPEQKVGSGLFFGDNRGGGFGLSVFARPGHVFNGSGPVRMGRRLRHVLVFRPEGATHRHPFDPADDGFAAATGGDVGFLDLGLSGHRRLGPPKAITSQIISQGVSARQKPLRLSDEP